MAIQIEMEDESRIDAWMALAERVKAVFPGLETAEAMEAHRRAALGFMRRASAICALDGERIVGGLLFSKEQNMLCFLAVDAAYRRQGVARRMVERMLPLMDGEKDVVVTTYREGAPEGAAARAFYARLGVVPGRLMEEFGSPVQEFVMKRQGGELQGQSL